MTTTTQTPALVRTIVPMIVGAAAAWLLAVLGITLPLEPATEVVTAILSGAYYALVRWLEQKAPAFGWLLGSPRQPVYTDSTADDDYVGRHREETALTADEQMGA